MKEETFSLEARNIRNSSFEGLVVVFGDSTWGKEEEEGEGDGDGEGEGEEKRRIGRSCGRGCRGSKKRGRTRRRQTREGGVKRSTMTITC